MISDLERTICHALRDLPAQHKNRYGPEPKRDLLELLFRALTGNREEYLRALFPQGLPNGDWVLAEAQGAQEGAEYSESARGKRCGHIFKPGEASYRCSTCTTDDTCVLCSRCWDASDHTGHSYSIMLSAGNSGCCDCGDEEAWRLPLFCAIHTATEADKGKEQEHVRVPDDFVQSIRTTVARALDYFCDVISCSPEQLRLPKTEEGIRQDEIDSRLSSEWYGEGDEAEESPEFALVLWNDEKHTIAEVTQQVTKACRERERFGAAKAQETHEIGRSVVKHSRDLQSLLHVSRIIEQIKVTVTVRSSRDTFREQMCGTIVEWLSDIAGCSVGGDNQILRQIICEEMLKPWRKGSGAYNADIGRQGLDDHEREEISRVRSITITTTPQVAQLIIETDDDDMEEEETAMGDIGEDLDGEEEEEDEGDDNDDNEDNDDNDYVDDEDDEDQMDLDIQRTAEEMEAEEDEDEEGDMDMGNAEDDLEADEALLAGYPPPPPPPPRPHQAQPAAPTQAQNQNATSPGPSGIRDITIPKTPNGRSKIFPGKTPKHWEIKPARYHDNSGMAYEDLRQRMRLDHMILFDLRLWKKTRIDLRDLYISTVVNVPQFKRILGLRISALYPALAQLYLIADREPDHAIINLSLQLLTTPSITEEIVERGNFLTNLMAILYTFLTTRQVGDPTQVSPSATLAFDAGSVTNRRLYHFFLDLRYLLHSEFVQKQVRTQPQYLLQFLDLVKLPQGICPNVRAVGEHVEYETDAWISASILMREINKLCRQFCDSFRPLSTREDKIDLIRAIAPTTCATIINSVGAERKRFDQAEIKDMTRFKSLPCFDFEVTPSGQIPRHRVVDFPVERGTLSFHHALHYTLSWLVECGKEMPAESLRRLLIQAATETQKLPSMFALQSVDPEDLLLAMFDYPLRVCAWLAQMKAGMWVRNGLSLRHQMSQYRGVSSRDVAYYRDIFLIQVALVTCNPSRVLASIADRFGMVEWMTRNYAVRAGFEDSQMIDIAEEFVHLLLVLLSDRTCLTVEEDEPSLHDSLISRDIAHVLCFKPLSYSDITARLSDKVVDSDSFQDILEEIAVYRPPEGLNDSGTFELKPEYIDVIDPYSLHYTKNQRDEAENIYKDWVAKKTGKKASDVVFEPKLRSITGGTFQHLPVFANTPLFAQIIYHCLEYTLSSKECTPAILSTRVETFLHVVLHLILTATIEDHTDEEDMAEDPPNSFVFHALMKSRMAATGNMTIIGLLQKISTMDEFSSCSAKIRHILKRFWQKRPGAYTSATATLKFPYDRVDTGSPASNAESEQEAKKKQALDRQARVMAQFQQQQQNFLNNQGGFDWGEEDFSDIEEDVPAAVETKMWKYPSGSCILCQEETNDSRLYGTFALIMDSNILRRTDVKDTDFVREALHTPTSLDRSADSIRPFGVAGENIEIVRRLDSTGKEIISEKQSLGKGFPSALTSRGPVTTSCGHIMHYSCFEAYYAATTRRHHHQVARNHPERLDLKEFTCPLCKALGNTFLPIIWKGKEESYPGVLATSEPFDRFLSTNVVSAIDRVRSQALIRESDKLYSSGYQKIFEEYITKNTVTPLANNINQLLSPNLTIPFAQPRALPGLFPTAEEVTSISPLQQASSRNETPMAELLAIYQRLRDTLRTNHIQSSFSYAPNMLAGDDLVNGDSLMKSFGYTISSLEIAQRGVESTPGSTLLERIPELTLTHLRVLSETAFAYASTGGLHHTVTNKTALEFREMHRRKVTQLFFGHPGVTGLALSAQEDSHLEPLFGLDTFVFLSESSLCLVPVLNVDVHHIIHLCYVAEIVKTVLAYIIEPKGLVEERERRIGLSDVGDQVPENKFALVRGFFDWIAAKYTEHLNTPAGAFTDARIGNTLIGKDIPRDMFLLLRRIASRYALPFLRKTTILLHSQYGVEFPNTGYGDAGVSELDRLTKLLQLPTVDEVFATFAQGHGDSLVPALAEGWIHHYLFCKSDYEMQQARPLSLTVSHPGIFELVGLPKYFDMLMDVANRKRCPSSGKELTDPSICLFCGAIFCSQAVCCAKSKLGGCNQHVLRCGKNIGLFINIRKCMVLYLHNGNGSWVYAPYLDKHGEVDPGLRRSRQLILNQKRYDKLLRDVWLTHNIPATISRKLEADVNNGGWETI